MMPDLDKSRETQLCGNKHPTKLRKSVWTNCFGPMKGGSVGKHRSQSSEQLPRKLRQVKLSSPHPGTTAYTAIVERSPKMRLGDGGMCAHVCAEARGQTWSSSTLALHLLEPGEILQWLLSLQTPLAVLSSVIIIKLPHGYPGTKRKVMSGLEVETEWLSSAYSAYDPFLHAPVVLQRSLACTDMLLGTQLPQAVYIYRF